MLIADNFTGKLGIKTSTDWAGDYIPCDKGFSCINIIFKLIKVYYKQCYQPISKRLPHYSLFCNGSVKLRKNL
jgi:hypothetical protein